MLLPIVGFLPGSVPLRLSTPWLAIVASLVVLCLGWWSPREAPVRPLAWLGLAAIGLAVLHGRHLEASFLWACQVVLLLAAVATLTQQRAFRWCRQAVLAAAWVQVVVGALQVTGHQTPWLVGGHGRWWGTVGSPTAAALVIGLGSLWATGWQAWALGLATVCTGSGTAIPIVLLRLVWPWRWRAGSIGLMAIGAVAVAGSVLWRTAWLSRWAVWQDWHPTWCGVGFHTFPGGFFDATPLGVALGWRDYHNVLLDTVTRFGLPGALVVGGLVAWVGLASARGEAWRRWTFAFALWVGGWQSLEPFPVLVTLLLVWWVGLLEPQGGARVAAL